METRTPVIDTRDERARAEIRRFGFAPLIVTATDAASAQTVITAGEAEVLEISALTIAHESHGGGASGNAAISLCIVDNGATASDANLAIKGLEVMSGAAIRLDAAIMLNPSQSLCAFSDTSGDMRVSGWVKAHL